MRLAHQRDWDNLAYREATEIKLSTDLLLPSEAGSPERLRQPRFISNTASPLHVLHKEEPTVYFVRGCYRLNRNPNPLLKLGPLYKHWVFVTSWEHTALCRWLQSPEHGLSITHALSLSLNLYRTTGKRSDSSTSAMIHSYFNDIAWVYQVFKIKAQ